MDRQPKQRQRGLKKLKWYCQVCKKQCSDENGYQNHLTTEKHLLLMREFTRDSESRIAEYSRLFEAAMLKLLRGPFAGKRVLATAVYNEYIKQRDHIHMNATRWASLNGFMRSLMQRGLVEIEPIGETFSVIAVEKPDPEEEQRQKELARRREEEDERVKGMLCQLADARRDAETVQSSLDQEPEAKGKLTLAEMPAKKRRPVF